MGYLGGMDQNSGMLYAARSRGGPIETLPEVPGLLLWRKGHIAVYEGGGFCIEARGFAYGTVRTRVAERDFTHWCQSSQLDYAEGAVLGAAEYAVCAGQGVHVRTGAGVEFESLGKADKGAKLLMLAGEADGWSRVAAVVGGRLVCGWMKAEYAVRAEGT